MVNLPEECAISLLHKSRDTTDVCLLIPVYNDWGALSILIERLGACLWGRQETFHILIVDDGSTDAGGDTLALPAAFCTGSILRLRRNLGHQRAIAIGLTWLHMNQPPDAVVVMDGDGEDQPEDVPRLLDRFTAGTGGLSVFAERTRRSEGLVFTSLYKLYQVTHRILTGIPVRIGNFSALAREHLASIVTSGDLWNHYAAAVVRLRVRMTTVPTHRGTRYSGESKMDLISLVRHGFNALAVHAEVIAVRCLVLTGTLTIVAFGFLAACVGIRLFTNWATPGWATYVSAFILIILLQVLSITFSVTLHSFSDSNSTSFLPIRDYAYFIGTHQKLGHSVGPPTPARP